jgi:hypothetical protein
MSDFYAVLTSELRDDPVSLGYASKTDTEVSDLLNDPTRDEVDHHVFVTLRGVIERLVERGIDPNATIAKLDVAAQSSPVVAEGMRALRYYGDGGGLDFANLATRAMVVQLQAAGVLTDQEAAAILSLGRRKASRAEALGLVGVNMYHVQSARAMMQE